MLSISNNDDVLLRKMNGIGVDISKEDFENIISEISKKYSKETDVDKMHPLSRAFYNLMKNNKKAKEVIFET